MSLFPRSMYNDSSFTPLFRLLDDFDTYRTETQQTGNGRKGGPTRSLRTFNPKFDVRETENTYELHGELPGIERENVSIEFTEPQTIVISGHVERSYSSGTPPAGMLDSGKQQPTITEAGEKEHHHHVTPHPVTVEDEASEQSKEATTTVAKKDQKHAPEQQQQQPKEKYWVSERSIGEFSRTFSFPTRVDQENVSASLANGVLNITVPKARKHETRKIHVQ